MSRSRTVAKSTSTTGMYVGPVGGGSGGGAWAAPRFHSSSPTHSPPTPTHLHVVVCRSMTDPPCACWLTDPRAPGLDRQDQGRGTYGDREASRFIRQSLP